jgi:DNA-binding PadR family transcriptional regulator
MPEPVLSTTSYAILSLLALRPYTTYELAKQMERSLHWFWPRAESTLYEEPKHLAARGFAVAEPGWTGRRRNTTYRITDEGREALRAWLAGPPIAPPQLECESILRVFAGDSGTSGELFASLDAMLRAVDAMQLQGVAIVRQALDGESPFPHRLHITALVHRFLWEYSNAMRRWAEWAHEEVRDWDDTTATPQKLERALRTLAETVAEPSVAAHLGWVCVRDNVRAGS